MNADIFNVKFIAESIAESKVADLDDNINLIATLFATKIDKGKIKKKKNQKIKKADKSKWANIPNKFFNYIHVTQCRRLFLLAW